MGVKIQGFDKLMPALQAKADRLVKAFLDDLDYLGLKAVAYIRNRTANDSWMDQTGNLRSSIGYVIVHDGAVTGRGGFERVDGPKRGTTEMDGTVEGKNYAEELAKNYPTGYALIVVAGMEYAAYVERMESKDVLASGEIFLKKEIKKLVNDYRKTYGK